MAFHFLMAYPNLTQRKEWLTQSDLSGVSRSLYTMSKLKGKKLNFDTSFKKTHTFISTNSIHTNPTHPSITLFILSQYKFTFGGLTDKNGSLEYIDLRHLQYLYKTGCRITWSQAYYPLSMVLRQMFPASHDPRTFSSSRHVILGLFDAYICKLFHAIPDII